MPASPETINEQATKPYTITRLSSETIRDLAKLHAAVYGPVTADHYPKKYDTDYTGVAFTGFIAYHRQEPIAYYGVIPCFIQYGDKIILAAQSADTMTHPQHRFKGMFVELSMMTFDLCREQGIRLLFGFPNENSYHGAVTKLGWRPAARMCSFHIPVRTLSLRKFINKIPLLARLNDSYTTAVLRRYYLPDLVLANAVIGDGFAGTCRTEEYRVYKKGFSKSRLIGIGKARIRIALQPILLVGEMEGVDEENIETVIHHLQKIGRRLGLKEIQFHCSEGISQQQVLQDRYPATPSYHVLYQDFGSAIPPVQLRFTFADLDIF